MSVDSALVMRRGDLPSAAALSEAMAEAGITVTFPRNFDLSRTAEGWVEITIDGEASGFDYAVDALDDLDGEDAPPLLRRYGDTLLSFSARGSLSAEAVTAIQTVLARRWNAAGWIEEELVKPQDMAADAVASHDMDPDLAATLRGSPAERAAAVDRYVAKFSGPTSVPDEAVIDAEQPEKHGFTWQIEHTIAIAIFVLALLGLILMNSFA